MKRRWIAALLLFWSVTAPLLFAALPASAAGLGSCQFTDKATISNCSFLSGITLTNSAGVGGFVNTPPITCHPAREVGETIYTITVGAKITGGSGGYNGTFKSVQSGISCESKLVNGAITISDPKGVGPNGGSPGPGGPATGDGGDNTPTCEGTLGPLGWILCGIFNTIGDASQWILSTIIQPLLITAPVSTDPTSPSYKVWSNFRVYGDIFLIFALLVIVFGQSLGGGLVDAYTAKKVLPRLLIAAILINLSLYIVALLVDLTNILGQGVGNLITEPLRQAGDWSFKISGGQIAGVFTVGLIGLLASSAAIAGVITGLIGLGGTAGAAALSLFFVLLPMILALVAVFVTLIIRKGIILLLLLISPVAFALYCLPNTEKYFRKWWDALVKTLLVYPIIMAIFAIADVLSVTILTANNVTPTDIKNAGTSTTTNTTFAPLHIHNNLAIIKPSPAAAPAATHSKGPVAASIMLHSRNNLTAALTDTASFVRPALLTQTAAAPAPLSNNPSEALAIIVAFIAQFIPLFLIPFSFRLAGGLLGRVHEFASSARDRTNKMTEGRRAHEKQKLQSHMLQNRQKAYENLKDQNKGSWARRKAVGFLQNRVGGYNIEAAMSAERARTGKEVNDQITTGKDEEIRGLTVNKAWANKQAEGSWWKYETDQAGNRTGRKQFKTLGGAWVNEADVDAGHQRWGRNGFAQQSALAYEMRKASTETELTDLADNYHNVAAAPGGWGMNDQQAGGAWIGASFEHQNKNLSFKYTNWQDGKMSQDKASKYITEMYEKRGSYNLSQMDSHAVEKLKQAYDATGNVDDRQKVAAISQTFMHELGTGAGGVAGMHGDEPAMAPGGAAGKARIASTPGAAHVAERVAELAEMTGVAKAEPRGQYVNPNHNPAPFDPNSDIGPNQRGQTRT